MTSHDAGSPDRPDLAAIAGEAEVELLAAETIDSASALDAAELGYYEAELTSLRDAATTVQEAEQRAE
jgi:hypothetical protein